MTIEEPCMETSLPAGILQIPFSSSTCTNSLYSLFLWISFSFLFPSHIQLVQSSSRSPHNIPFSGFVSIQLLGRPSNTTSGLTVCLPWGPFNVHISKRRGHYCKWSPLALALWRKWPCLDNGLSQSGGGKKRERHRVRAVCTVTIICVYEKPPDNRGTGGK